MENITVRLKLQEFTDQSRMRTEAAASSNETMPRLAFNRKDTRWRIDWRERLRSRQAPENACSVAVSWPVTPAARINSRNRGHIAS
jgi:hypothetical protein